MTDRLPPLTALRAFDAAARHMSFARAADELNVTPAALSFQIKSLEEHLGAALFRRLPRRVELSEAGRALAPGARDGFETLQAAWRAARRMIDTNTLTVTAGPAFTAKWLAPRLYEFARQNPEIDLRFTASLRLLDLDRDEIDVAIRFGYGGSGAKTDPDREYYSVPLRREWVTPVMTPEMARRYPTPESLREAPLMFDDSIDFLDPPCNWETWFRATGMAFSPKHGPHFSQADHAVDAAVSGAGVVLGRRAMVVKEIADGRLVAPFDLALGTKARFRFLCRKGAETQPRIAAFRDWILAEIDKTAHISERFRIVAVEDVPRS